MGSRLPIIDKVPILHLPTWKKTALGTPIELFASHDLETLRREQLRPILLMGGIHGDEPEGVELATKTLEWLKSNTSDGKDSSASSAKKVCPWIIVPCLNVDGFKNRTRVNGRGVDLNRNYPSKDWNQEARAERYFPGPSPASEPEIQGVVELVRDFSPRLIIHCHSWKPCIVGAGPSGWTDTKRLSESSGYEAMEDIGYPTPGSLSQYGFLDLGIPVICIEEQDEMKDLSSIWPRFEKGIKAVFHDLSMREESPRSPQR
jgi:murein peptide amidase A